jgi:hypothetical protein
MPVHDTTPLQVPIELPSLDTSNWWEHLEGVTLEQANDVFGSFSYLCGLTPPTHENELAKWREIYKDGKAGPFDGIIVKTNPDVFPSHEGDTSRDIAIAIRELEHFHERAGEGRTDKISLDMGCGNGALGLTIATLSAYSTVFAVDNHAPAVENARENIETRPEGERAKLSVYHSDMLRDVPRQITREGQSSPLQFDLIVFNHPYYPREGTPEFGMGTEGGREMIERFFQEIEPLIHDETEIIMPYASDVDEEHDPARIAGQLGFSVSVLRERIDSAGISHKVYRFCKSERLADKLPTTIVREGPREEWAFVPALAA